MTLSALQNCGRGLKRSKAIFCLQFILSILMCKFLKKKKFTYCPVLVKTTIAVAIVLMAASTAAIADACAELHGPIGHAP